MKKIMIVLSLFLLIVGCGIIEEVDPSLKVLENLKSKSIVFEELETGKINSSSNKLQYEGLLKSYPDKTFEELIKQGYSEERSNQILAIVSIYKKMIAGLEEEQTNYFLAKIDQGVAREGIYLYNFSIPNIPTEEEILLAKLNEIDQSNFVIIDEYLIVVYNETLASYDLSLEELVTMLKN